MASLFGNFRLQPHYNQKDHYLPKRRKYLSPKLRTIKTLREPEYFVTYSMTYATVTNFSFCLTTNSSEILRFCGGHMFTLTNAEGAKIIS